jgi:hypothetical protein
MSRRSLAKVWAIVPVPMIHQRSGSVMVTSRIQLLMVPQYRARRPSTSQFFHRRDFRRVGLARFLWRSKRDPLGRALEAPCRRENRRRAQPVRAGRERRRYA